MNFKISNNFSKIMIINYFKMIFAAISSVCVAMFFKLEFSVSAGIVAMLSIQPSKRETFSTAFARFIAFLIALFISFFCFKFLGINVFAFFVFLVIYVFICQYFKWISSIVMNSVLISHFLTLGKMDFYSILNECFIFLIGVLFGIFVNLHLHKKSLEIETLKDNLDNEIKNILYRMSQRIVNKNLENYDGSCFVSLNKILFDAKTLAAENSKNQLKKDDFDIYYINMREKQIMILYEMFKRVKNIQTPPETAKIICNFLEKISTEYQHKNNCTCLLQEFEEIMLKMKEKPLPKTRVEFENRAELFTLLKLTKEFLEINIP